MKLNHIGIVVDDIEAYTALFEAMGLSVATTPQSDSIQRVTACFVSACDSPPIHIEFLEPTDETSPIANFLRKRGGGIHHLCFEVTDIPGKITELTQKGLKLISGPVRCLGYDRSFEAQGVKETRIAFLLAAKTILVELLETGQGNSNNAVLTRKGLKTGKRVHM